MTLNDILAGGFILFMIIYFFTVHKIIVETRVGDVDKR